MSQKKILEKLKKFKVLYAYEGITIVGLFGSYAKEKEHDFSDIDILYHLDYDTFSKKYRDGFSKVLRLDAIKDELEKSFNHKVDFVSDSNKVLLKEVIYV